PPRQSNVNGILPYPRHTLGRFRALTLGDQKGPLAAVAFLWSGSRGEAALPPRGGIMRRVIVLTAWGLSLAPCSAAMPSLDFLKSAAQSETLAIESVPPGAEAKTSLGQSCRTPCQLAVQPGSEFSVTFALSGYQTQTVSVRPEADGASATPQLSPN